MQGLRARRGGRREGEEADRVHGGLQRVGPRRRAGHGRQPQRQEGPHRDGEQQRRDVQARIINNID